MLPPGGVARGDVGQLRIRAVVSATIIVGALAVLTAAASAQDPGATTTTAPDAGGDAPVVVTTGGPDAPEVAITSRLVYQTGEGAEREVVPVPGVAVTVLDASGEVVEEVETDDDGEFLVELEGPGTYTVSIDPETLPDGVELRGEDEAVNEVTVAREVKRVLFALQEEGAAGRGEAGDGERFLKLLVEGIKFGLVIAMMAVGLSLIFGTTGLTNFAHGELVVVGTVITWFLNDAGIFLPIATLIAMVVMFFVGAGIDRGLWRPLRNHGTSLIAMLVISIGMSIALRYLTLYVFRDRPRPFRDFAVQQPYEWGPITIVPKDVWAIGISVLVLTLVGLVLTRTRIGKAIRAVADNPDLARSSGIDVDRVILVVWGTGAALATLGGVQFAMSELVDWQFGSRMLLLMFAGVTLGGLGTAFGAFVGSLIVGIVIQVSTFWVSPELKNVSALVLLILILVVRPQGIFGRRERIG